MILGNGGSNKSEIHMLLGARQLAQRPLSDAADHLEVTDLCDSVRMILALIIGPTSSSSSPWWKTDSVTVDDSSNEIVSVFCPSLACLVGPQDTHLPRRHPGHLTSVSEVMTRVTEPAFKTGIKTDSTRTY